MVCASFCSVVHRVRALVPSSVGLETVSEIWSHGYSVDCLGCAC